MISNHVKNRNHKFVIFTFYKLTSSYCKVNDGVVRNLFKLILCKPRLKFIRLGLVTKLNGRLFHGWTTLHEKKCFLMLVFAIGTMNRNWWPRVLVLGENVKKVWGWRQMLLWTMLKQVCRSYWSRRCSRVCIPRVLSRSSYDKLESPGRRFVNVRCTFSIVSIRPIWVGFQAREAYSRSGRTYILKARTKLWVFFDKNDLWISAAILYVILMYWFLHCGKIMK